MAREMETVTLHFDLMHLGHLGSEQDFTLKLPGARRTLMWHTAQTRSRHAESNSALAQLNHDQRNRFTHYAEKVSLPTDAVSFCWVGYPARRPGAVSDESAVIFQHVPRSAARRALHTLRRTGALTVPHRLRAIGVDLMGDEGDVEAPICLIRQRI